MYDVTYDEGVLVGYRWYDTRKIEPLFPFWYGLSYTQFEYSSLSLTPLSGDGERLCTVSVDVTNTGDREGAEVVQLYIRDVECTVVRPEKELKGFEKITLAPGDKRTVSFTVFRRDLSYWDSTCRGFRAEDGTFEMLIGSSSRDIRLSGFYELKS
ncbi:MAG: fibronectin type III-like domain-contianing protein [Spirochaetota bacterium]